MKKRAMKLKLHRETLRNLTAPEARRARGAAEETSSLCLMATGCECATETGCPGTELLTQPCTLATRCVC